MPSGLTVPDLPSFLKPIAAAREGMELQRHRLSTASELSPNSESLRRHAGYLNQR